MDDPLSTATILLVALLVVFLVVDNVRDRPRHNTTPEPPAPTRSTIVDHYLYREELIVQLRDGSSLRGVLWELDDDHVILQAGEHLDIGGNRAAVDGAIVVPVSSIAWIQSITAALPTSEPGGSA